MREKTHKDRATAILWKKGLCHEVLAVDICAEKRHGPARLYAPNRFALGLGEDEVIRVPSKTFPYLTLSAGHRFGARLSRARHA